MLRSRYWRRDDDEDDFDIDFDFDFNDDGDGDDDDSGQLTPAPTPTPQPVAMFPPPPDYPYDPTDLLWIAYLDAIGMEWEEFRRKQQHFASSLESTASPTIASQTTATTSAATQSSPPPLSTPTVQSSPSDQPADPTPYPEKQHPPEPPKDPEMGGGKMAAAVIIPLLFISFLGALIYIVLKRRRRRQRTIEAQEKRMMNPGEYTGVPQSYSNNGPPAMASVPPPNLPPAILNRTPSQPPPPFQALYPDAAPIILGPMNTSNNGTYMTGLDMSDAIPINDPAVPRESQRFLSGPPEDPDEPPPPYRPRSVATILSRQASTRAGSLHRSAGGSFSEEHLIVANGGRPDRSPFDDPEDNADTVSVISQPGRNRFRLENDGMSEVSDLSYQSSIRRPQ